MYPNSPYVYNKVNYIQTSLCNITIHKCNGLHPNTPNIHLKTQRRFIQTFKYALLKVMSTNATPCILNTSSMHCNNDVTVCLLTPLLCTVNMRCVCIQTSMHCKRCVSKPVCTVNGVYPNQYAL